MPRLLLVLAFGALCACSRQPGNYSAVTSVRGCITDDQCESGELCVFRLCTPGCGDTRSCDHGAVCLDTSRGAACVQREYNACVDDSDCPNATACTDGRCVSDCQPDAGEACGDCINELCVPGSTGITTLDAGTSSDGGATTCKPGPAQCRAGMVVRCDDAGKSQTAACPFACKDGACTGTCKPGELRCQDLVRERCDDNGAWSAVETCARTCRPDSCESTCENGARECNDNMLTACFGGRMIAIQTCDYVCRAGACSGACEPGSRSCRNNAVLTCSADAAWGAPVDCGVNACVNGACGGECVPGSQRCTGGATYQMCDRRGEWGDDVDCRNRTCIEGSCTGVCTPGAKQCEGPMGVLTCGADGQWGARVPCMGQVCEDGACVEPCGPETLRCAPGDAGLPQRCSPQRQWQDAPRCTPTQTCVEGVCRGECAPGARRCDPDDSRNVQTCGDAGEWGSATPCGAEQRCAGEGMCGLGDMCPAGMSPQWWGEGDGVDRMANDPRWGGMLESFSNDEQSMPAGYAIVFDRRANQLAITFRTSAEDTADPADYVYFGITGNENGMMAPRAVRIALIAPTMSDDPRILTQFTGYEFASGMWTITPARPAWIEHAAAWISGADPGWVVSIRVDLAAAGVDSAMPFRIALGLHAENQFGELTWSTPSALPVSDPTTIQPRMWPALDVTMVQCVSRVDVP